MLKNVALILSIFFLVLSVKPCSDGANIDDKHQDEITVNHNHQEDSDDSCPVTCICDCCGMAITYESIKTYDLKITREISTKLISTYHLSYSFKLLSNIWQPPQIIN